MGERVIRRKPRRSTPKSNGGVERTEPMPAKRQQTLKTDSWEPAPASAPRPVGRPSVYSERTLVATRAYLRDDLSGSDEVIHTVEGLAWRLGVSTVTLQRWRQDEDKAEFCALLENLQDIQRRELLNNGLAGGYNSTIAKLILSRHGYVEKTETDLSSSDGSMTPQVIERVIVRPDAEK